MADPKHVMLLWDGRFEGSTRENLESAFATLGGRPSQEPLIVHFHGGLVDLAAGIAIAERLLPTYSAAPAYPLFVVWRSGVLETVRTNWQELVTGDLFGLVRDRALQFVVGWLRKDEGAKALGVSPPPILEVATEVRAKTQLGQEPFAEEFGEETAVGGRSSDDLLGRDELELIRVLVEGDRRFAGATRELDRAPTESLGEELRLDVGAARAVAADGEGEKAIFSSAALALAVGRVALRTISRLMRRRNHGVYTTVVEEVAREVKGDVLGRAVWQAMKQDTADAFAGPAATHGGSALLHEIAAMRARGDTRRIVLVGHSTGAVYICHLLRAAQATLPPDLRFDVIFLAPACTFELLDDTITIAGDRISGFRSFGMQDDLEKRDAILAPIYQRSLLYFVSGLLESEADTPIVGMQRYHCDRKPFDRETAPSIARVLDRLGSKSPAWVWSECSAGPGIASSSRSHGGFDDDETTLASVVHLAVRDFH